MPTQENILSILKNKENPKVIDLNEQYLKIVTLIDTMIIDARLKNRLLKQLTAIAIRVKKTEDDIEQTLKDSLMHDNPEDHKAITELLMEDVIQKQQQLMNEIEQDILTNEINISILDTVLEKIMSFFSYLENKILHVNQVVLLAFTPFKHHIKTKSGTDVFAAIEQSSHLKSVHTSINKAVTKLQKKYGPIDQLDQEKILKEIEKKLKTIKINKKPEKLYRKAMLDSFERIIKHTRWEEYNSRMTLPEILTLIWTAAKDQQAYDTAFGVSTTPNEDIEARLEVVAEFLWRAQRDYNISAEGTDDLSLIAKPACLPGTFHKIVESMELHPLVTVTKVITPVVITLAVKESALEYYENLTMNYKELFLKGMNVAGDLDDPDISDNEKPQIKKLLNSLINYTIEHVATDLNIPKNDSRLKEQASMDVLSYLEYPETTPASTIEGPPAPDIRTENPTSF